MRAHGFTMIELACYLALVAWISFLLMAYTARTLVCLRSEGAQCRLRARMRALHTLLARDVHGAPALRRDWYVVTPNELVWCGLHGNAIGWRLQSDGIVRVHGTYDLQHRQWQERTTSRVLQCKKLHGAFSLQTYQTVAHGAAVRAVALATTIAEESDQLTIALRNRVEES